MLDRELARRLDAILVRPDALPPELHAHVTAALQLGVGHITVSPIYVRNVAMMCQGSGIVICSTVGYPTGQSKATVKAIEATSTIKDGAAEVVVVPDLANLIRGDVDGARAELIEIVRAARSTRRDVVVRVVVEAPLLLSRAGPAAVRAAARAARESGCDVLQTSAGTLGGPLTPEVVTLLKTDADTLLVEAVDPHFDPVRATAFLAAGADRLGYLDLSTA
jgi:deoxyribose-phosphate aldolase